MKDKILTHIRLGRFFAAPPVVCAVLLGCALGGELSWISAMICLAAVFQMAYSHSFNTLLDYSWTGLDKGAAPERSRGKIYTHGQQVIASGKMSPMDVFSNGMVYLIISCIFIGVVTVAVAPAIWPIWALWWVGTIITFWYSWGKLHYQCELALGVGFGPLACMLGMATQPNPDFLTAFLAGIPFLIIWGFAAEFVDQAIDAEPNWPRGLRNLGALAWKNNVSVPIYVVILTLIGYVAQGFLIAGGVLAPLTGLSLIALPLVVYGALIMGNDFNKTGVIMLLLACLVHMIAFTVGQIIGG